jgi:hypothetical protein
MNPVRRLLELIGLKPRERKKRLPVVGNLLDRIRGLFR